MEDLALPKRRRTRRDLTASLACAVAVMLAAPLALILKHRAAVIPDQDEGFEPIAALSGSARDAPRVRPAKEEPRVVLASAISWASLTAALSPSRARTRPPTRLAAPRVPRMAPRPARPARKKRLPPRQAAAPRAVRRAPEPPALAPRPLEPVAEPDLPAPPAPAASASAPTGKKPSVIVETVPSN